MRYREIHPRCDQHPDSVMHAVEETFAFPEGPPQTSRGFRFRRCVRVYATSWGYIDVPERGRLSGGGAPRYECHEHLCPEPVFLFVEGEGGAYRWACPVLGCSNSRTFAPSED